MRFAFVCPTCGNRFVYDGAVAPLCTGPHASLDEHEATVMVPAVAVALGAAVTPTVVLPGGRVVA